MYVRAVSSGFVLKRPPAAYNDVREVRSADSGRQTMSDSNQKETKKPVRPHSLQLAEHRLLSVSGVKAVPTFTDKLIEIELEGESLVVTGHDLTVKGLDLETGQFNASGYVTSMKYSSAVAPSSIIRKIFK